MSVFLSILTPTYNRGNLLSKCYKSLKEQSLKDFEWVIIDDGSTDNTNEYIKKCIEEDEFPIRYFKKDNGGKHTALKTK